jgi:hypothetical protein
VHASPHLLMYSIHVLGTPLYACKFQAIADALPRTSCLSLTCSQMLRPLWQRSSCRSCTSSQHRHRSRSGFGLEACWHDMRTPGLPA